MAFGSQKMSINISYLITLQGIREKAANVASSTLNALNRANEKISQGLRNVKQSLNRRGKADMHPYQHIFRKKTKWELIILSCAVCGIEFCYSAETAYVSPILLEMGLNIKYMTLIWCLSPVFGFLLTPTLGSLSDSCKSRFGRRRPFIILLSTGIFLGLILVPNGKDIGLALGDLGNHCHRFNVSEVSPNVTYSTEITRFDNECPFHPFGITFTVLGVILLDFCCDSCQSPARSYLLDVTIPEQHSHGLSMFTFMAGFGGSLGYVMGAVQWEGTIFTAVLGDHVHVIFVVVTLLFLIAVTVTVNSFAEIPLGQLQESDKLTQGSTYQRFWDEDIEIAQSPHTLYGTVKDENKEHSVARHHDMILYSTGTNECNLNMPMHTNPLRENEYPMVELTSKSIDDASEKAKVHPQQQINIELASQPTIKDYFLSIVKLPKSLRILCLTNLFCWMSLVCYSLYFTDFVGEAVFGGDPIAQKGSLKHNLYQKGVRYGCWGMALYSLTCSCYSYCMDKLVNKFGTKSVYICGQMVYSFGMALMSIFHHPTAVIILSPTAGIMYATLFTMPYLLIARYHCTSKFDEGNEAKQIRGMGTDVAIVSSMVFVAQFILSLCMGSIVYAVGSSVAIVCAASVLSLCGAICATQVLHVNLDNPLQEQKPDIYRIPIFIGSDTVYYIGRTMKVISTRKQQHIQDFHAEKPSTALLEVSLLHAVQPSWNELY